MKSENQLVLAIGSMRAAAKIVSEASEAEGKPRDAAEEFCYAALQALEWVYDGRDPKGVMKRFINLGLSTLQEQYQKTGNDPQAMLPLLTPQKREQNDG